MQPSDDSNDPEDSQGTTLSWGQVAQASQQQASQQQTSQQQAQPVPLNRAATPRQSTARAPEAGAPQGIFVPKRKDWVQHPNLGLCEVEVVRGDQIMLKLPSVRRKWFRLSYLQFGSPEHDERGRRIFPATVGRVDPTKP